VSPTVNIIGDIAGRYETLLALLEKLPPADITVLCGDMVDRGPRNVDVLQLARSGLTPQGGKLLALLGNHDLMMLGAQVDAFDEHGWPSNDLDLWLGNGGAPTKEELDEMSPEARSDLMKWVDGLPIYYRYDDLLITHAPVQMEKWHPDFIADRMVFTWARRTPPPRLHCAIHGQRLLNVHGHNGKLKIIQDDSGPQSVCIDESNDFKMSAFCWPSMQVVSINQIEPEYTWLLNLTKKRS